MNISKYQCDSKEAIDNMDQIIKSNGAQKVYQYLFRMNYMLSFILCQLYSKFH